jgi:hypothetical protein
MKFVWLNLLDYYKAANNFDALVNTSTISYIYDESSFTQVPKA